MPYINCDGRTYSRYDTSPYVRECIAKEDRAWAKQRLEQKKWCEANPVECKRIHDEKFDCMLIAVGLCLAISILIAYGLSKAMEG